MESTGTRDSAAAAARHARFGSLPERIRYEDMVQEQRSTPVTGDAYDPERSFVSWSCVALDLGL
ncbi:hypothetical protein [Actinacidiphila bryophytorum]|uniref:Uncharacterized protein n=1 Tax=Actinacidiphila bryophytorum TaxID=1436133 RepID=A0A9W4MBH3_9ACTN|nr:hypothetical protein [Actinacidiphila bryophytorum]MBM9434894.1 hypothetical protein [Actinacidiphila bryophytorum]MBN6547314.1 hypothetical protein [Actinacidiphila bryophytorum]CAG7641090.1 conserved hypothetical protein [Actinacidiphila bryophytorum]